MNMAAAPRLAYQKRNISHDSRILREEMAMPDVKPRSRHQLPISARAMVAIVLVSCMIFAALVGLVFMKYAVAETQIAINDLNSAIHEVENERTRLEQRLDNAMNINQIMSRASALGMGQPTPDQIMYITMEDGLPAASMSAQD